MGMGMKSLKWEGFGTKNLFLHISTVYEYSDELLGMSTHVQRDRATRFINRSNKRDLQAHLRSSVFVSFDRRYTISY